MKLLRTIALFTTFFLLSTPVLASDQGDKWIGVWAGTWSDMNGGPKVMPSTLTIRSVVDGKVDVDFRWEAAPQWKVEAGKATPKTAQVEGNVLSWEWKKQQYRFAFTLNPDGTLSGGRWVDGKQTGKVDLIKESKIEAKAK